MEPTLVHLSLLFSLHTLSWGSAFTQSYTSSFNTFRRKTSTSQKLKVFKKLSLCSLDKEVLFKTFLFYDCQDKSVLQDTRVVTAKRHSTILQNKKLLTVVKWYILFLDGWLLINKFICIAIQALLRSSIKTQQWILKDFRSHIINIVFNHLNYPRVSMKILQISHTPTFKSLFYKLSRIHNKRG